MKNILSSMKTLIVLLALAVAFLGFYAYMLVRPISYGMAYHHESVYESVLFEATLEFYPDGKEITRSTTFEDGLESRYYYKDGYLFTLTAQTDAEYDEEVAYINGNFDEAVNAPFYASKINAFKLVNPGYDGTTITYVCAPAIVFAIIGGVVELALIVLSCFSFLIRKKQNNII